MNTSMRRIPRLMLLIVLICTGSARAELATSEWVHPGPDGKLVYKTTPTGDRIVDFSHAGYMGGGVALPDVPVKVMLNPTGADDETDAIQQAIDKIAAMPMENGFRGAVLLSAGTFNCSRMITIGTSGVVLRGSGSGAGGGSSTTIMMNGRPHLAFAIRSGGGGRGRGASTQPANDDDSASVQTSLADAYVAAGTMTINVTNAHGFAVGDVIEIRRPVTEAWVKFMEMDDMTRNGRDQTWIKAGNTLPTERRIAAIDGNKIMLDVPLTDSYDAKYLEPPGTTVAKIRLPARVTQAGIEHLHIQCPDQEISHTQPHFTAMRINGEDCWARDVIIDETMNSVAAGGRRITLERVSVNRKAMHQGASKPAEFAPNGDQVLMDRCSVSGDNVWFIATGAGHAGPNVALNCTFFGSGRAESHQRWSTALLYDNVRAPTGGIELRNRGSMGSGHGWSMGWGVVWNCVAKDYIVQNPPGSANWLIGSTGEAKLSPRPFGSGPLLPQGTVDSHDKPVAPRSLYLAQLKERLGPEALKNIGYASENDIKDNQFPAVPRAEVKPSIDPELGEDQALNHPVTTSNVRNKRREFAGWKALDGDEKTYWATEDSVKNATLELDTEGALDVNALQLAEARGFENRVEEYKVEGQVDSDWKLLSQGTSIGARKIDRFPKVTVWKVKLTIVKASEYPAIHTLGLYLTK